MTSRVSLTRYARIALLCAMVLPVAASAQTNTEPVTATKRPVVVDQTGLPLPGVRIDVYRGDQIVQSVVTDADGGFDLLPGQADDILDVALEGFETTKVRRSSAERIVLPLARASDVTEVVASALTSSGSSMERLGSTMSAPMAERLPTPRPRILQSLPLLPAVIRGRDGLLRIGGTQPHESSLWIDGFDVTDPVTNTTAIDLPNESVKGMAIVRDPISATFSDVLGSMASIETTAGTGDFRLGVQGFIPRPRIDSRYGLGRIDTFFPRAYVGGRAGNARYFTSMEYAFERVPIPGVTTQSGSPAAGSTGIVSFSRVDVDISPRNTLTLEGLFLPARTSFSGLSPLQQPAAAPNIRSDDLFGGIVDRVVMRPSELLTFRIGIINHTTDIDAAGSGDAVLQPVGWQQNWFSAVNTTGTRRSASVTWDKGGISAAGTHTVSVSAEIQQRTMSSAMNHQSIQIEDDLGNLTRLIEFAPTPQPLTADDFGAGMGIRDLWDLTSRLQLDFNLRLDWDQGAPQLTPSPRFSFRYAFDEASRTTLKASAGRFVGLPPLGALTFSQFPVRSDSSFDPATGALISTTTVQPTARTLDLPRADGVALELEHTLRQGLDVQAAVRLRHGTHLPTVSTGLDESVALLDSTGTSLYREVQFSVRETWSPDAELFVSYVHSSSQSELNDFGTLFTNLDAPLIEPGGTVTTATDVPDRLRAWATVLLPERIVVSPAVDWRTGFPYSLQDEYRHYVGTPDSQRFPTYFAVDLTTFKTFDLFSRKMDLGLQVFNLTDHFNPRDVISVVQSVHFGELTNNPGVTIGGYMQIRW